MIDQRYINEINKAKIKAFFKKILPYIVFAISFVFSYHFKFKYSGDTNLFNDKLIDVSSIFFGIFIGCLYLFEKFRSNETYNEFLKFCKILLYQNLGIIIFSFFIILVNDALPIDEVRLMSDYYLDIRSAMFSIYIAMFAVTLFNIIGFIRIILIILKGSMTKPGD